VAGASFVLFAQQANTAEEPQAKAKGKSKSRVTAARDK
jgi:hypothetical protein